METQGTETQNISLVPLCPHIHSCPLAPELPFTNNFYGPQRSSGKVISEACVKNSVHGWGVCVVVGMCVAGGVHDEEGICDGERVW